MAITFGPPSGKEGDDFVIVPDTSTDEFATQVGPLGEKKLEQVRIWLEPTPYNAPGGEYRKHASSHLTGTGDWLTASPPYQDWLTSHDSGLLWIKGIPGSGKSVMAAKIIADLAANKAPVLFFFFRQIINANHKPTAMLRDWLHQLLPYSPPLQRRLFSYVQEKRSLESITIEDFWKDLKMAFTNLPDKVFCVTDALDEVDQGNDSFLRTLASLGQWQPEKVKLLITSRPVPSVEVPLHMQPGFKVRLEEDQVDVDISRFVQHSLEISRIDRQHWPAIIQAVPGRANGLFLYARLAMDEFLRPDADAVAVLSQLPRDLNVLYTSLLNDHIERSGVEEGVQRQILQAVTHATRPLRLLELAEMVRFVDTDGSGRTLRSAKSLVKTACGPLLEILADETVSVIHHSFTEYLKGVTRPIGDSGYPVLQHGVAHTQLAVTCLRYLQCGCLGDVPIQRSKDMSSQNFSSERITLWKRNPFLKYASGNWFKHAVAAYDASCYTAQLRQEIGQFLDNKNLLPVWLRLESMDTFITGTKAHVSAKLGLTEYIRQMISLGEDVDSSDQFERTPLWWAATEGHLDMVRQLIATGAKPDQATTCDGFSTLHKAAQENHFAVVEALLQAGVNPLIRKRPAYTSNLHMSHVVPEYGESPLQIACKSGHLESVDVFLKHINNLSTAYWSLAWASFYGQSRLVERILEYPGLDVNHRLRGDTFLHLACCSLNPDTVTCLLLAGADAKALSVGETNLSSVDIDYTPVPTAPPLLTCLHGLLHGQKNGFHRDSAQYTEIMTIMAALVQAGVDVNQRTRNGETALHWATGSPDLVRALISFGADPHCVDSSGNTPLHTAKNEDVVTLLIEEAGADINARNNGGATPLLAAVARFQSTTQRFLDLGADCNLVDDDGNNALHLIFDRNYFRLSPEQVEAFLKAGANPNLKNHDGHTPFQKIAYFEELSKTATLLLEAGANVDEKDKQGRTLLFRAIGPEYSIYLRGAAVKYLLMAGASKDSRDSQGRSMSHEAVKGFASEIDIDCIITDLDLLDSSGLLDMNAVDNAGNGLLHELSLHMGTKPRKYAIQLQLMQVLVGAGLDMSQKNLAGRMPLHLLCALGKAGRSRLASHTPLDFAISKTRNIDEPDANGNTPLHIASVYGESCCKRLLDAGADPTLRNHDKLTPLHLAARCKQSNVVGMLLSSIKEKYSDSPSKLTAAINATAVTSNYSIHEPYNITPLFYACQSGRPETVELLLQAGADPNIGNLFTACALMEYENRLWPSKLPAPCSDIVALRASDTTRPSLADEEYQATTFHQNTTTRLEEILEMLIAAGIDTSQLDAGVRNQPNPFFKAASVGSGYAYRCLKMVRDKYGAPRTEDPPNPHRYRDDMEGFSLFDEQMVVATERASVEMMHQCGWVKPDGVDFEIFRAIILRRQYHLVHEMIRAKCRFLNSNMLNLQFLITHGLASLVDAIADAETKARLSGGEWHAYGDPTKPGLHFESGKTDESEPQATLLKLALERALPNMQIVQLLVDKYAVNINGTGRDKRSPLHVIANGSHWWQVALALPYLLARGADVEARDSEGQTPLHVALASQDRELGPFHGQVARALIEAGADVNAVDGNGQNCLALAGYSFQLTKLLLENGAVAGPGAIFTALKSSNVSVLKMMLKAGADANCGMPDMEQETGQEEKVNRSTFDKAHIRRREITPLYFVASDPDFSDNGNMQQCFKLLLDHGADLYAEFYVSPRANPARDGNGRGDAGIACDAMLGIGTASNGDLGDIEKRMVLHELVRLGRLNKYMLRVVDIDASRRDRQGCNLLHAICDSYYGPDQVLQEEGDEDTEETDQPKMEDDMTVFQELLGLGCNIHERDDHGQTVLHRMVYRGWWFNTMLERFQKSVSLIAQIAPDLLNARNNAGNTPLHYSALMSTYSRRKDASDKEQDGDVHWKIADLTRLLLRCGANPAGVNKDGNSVLHLLAHNLDDKDIRALFSELVRDHGLDVNARNVRGDTPLTLFVKRTDTLRHLLQDGYNRWQQSVGLVAAVEMLQEAGADFLVKDRHGNGLLHMAASEGAELFKALMDRGGLDPLMENQAHQTPIDVAAVYGNTDVLALFGKKLSSKAKADGR